MNKEQSMGKKIGYDYLNIENYIPSKLQLKIDHDGIFTADCWDKGLEEPDRDIKDKKLLEIIKKELGCVPDMDEYTCQALVGVILRVAFITRLLALKTLYTSMYRVETIRQRKYGWIEEEE